MPKDRELDEGDPRRWRKLVATLGAAILLFAPACEANIETDDPVETEDEGDVDLDDDTVEDEEDDVDVDVEDDEEDL